MKKYIVLLFSLLTISHSYGCNTSSPDTKEGRYANLCSKNPMPQTVNLFRFLQETYGKKIISGTMAHVAWNTDEADWVFAQTGKYPALNGFDYIHLRYSPSGWIDYGDISPVENWWKAHGLVSGMWHWNVPQTKGNTEYAFYAPGKGQGSPETDFDISRAVQDGTDENLALRLDLVKVADYLLLLAQKGIPVIWRPLHEASGGWFWWGAKGPGSYKALWKMMFEVFEAKGVNNLIWVWTSEGHDLDWYPGDEYVDLIGMDIYREENAHASLIDRFKQAERIGGGKKMIALSECGGIPAPDLMFEKGDTWLWFMPWYDAYTRQDKWNGAVYWKTVMNDPRIITRDQMPNLKE